MLDHSSLLCMDDALEVMNNTFRVGKHATTVSSRCTSKVFGHGEMSKTLTVMSNAMSGLESCSSTLMDLSICQESRCKHHFGEARLMHAQCAMHGTCAESCAQVSS